MKQGRTHGGRRERKLPVFVFPEELKFVSEDESAHKQILTLYNPYDFNIKFQILSNAPQKYAVVESQGVIKAHCCVDVVVRHRMAADGPFNVTDKLRVDIFVDKKLIGRKQVLSSLHEGKANTEVSEDKELPGGHFLSISGGGGGGGAVNSSSTAASSNIAAAAFGRRHSAERQPPRPNSSPSILMVAIAIACLGILLLPLDGESPSWPTYLHITVNQKLVAAFALGLVTMALFKS